MFTKKTRLISLLVTISMLISMVAYFTISVTANSGAIEIDDASDFASIAPDGSYILVNDIDFTGVEHTPIGSIDAPFTGTFDGNGYTISGLNLETTDNYVGLFGVNNGTIRKVTLDDTCSITGNAYVGAIAGKNKGMIEDCISYATVSYNAPANISTNTYSIMDQNLCQWGDTIFAALESYDTEDRITRRPGMVARINAADPDIISFQEVSFSDIKGGYTYEIEHKYWWGGSWTETVEVENNIQAWNTYLWGDGTNNGALSGTYSVYGSYRDTSEDPLEGVQVAYKTEKFEKIDQGHFWLSEEPNDNGAVSDLEPVWDAGNVRICSWVALRDKSTGQVIVVYAVHLDAYSDEAREKGALLIKDRMETLKGTAGYENAIFIAAGDYNANSSNIAVKNVLAAFNDEMVDARSAAEEYPDAGNEKQTTGESIFEAADKGTIDHILIDGSAAEVETYDILNGVYNSAGELDPAGLTTTKDTVASDCTVDTALRPSDHEGVLVTFEALSNINIGGITGENDGAVKRVVAAGTTTGKTEESEHFGTVIGNNNGTSSSNFVADTTEGAIGEGKVKGINLLTKEPSLEIVWKLNHAAENQTFGLINGEYKILNEADGEVIAPVRVVVNGKDYYVFAGGEFDLSKTGIPEPRLITEEDEIIELEDYKFTVEKDINVSVATDIANIEKAKLVGVVDYIVDSAEDLLAVEKNLDVINNKEATIFMGADIDLSDTTFNGFDGNIYFSFNGCGKKISNWSPAENTTGFFNGNSGGKGYQGRFIKNVTFENVHLKGYYGRSVVVGMAAGENDFKMENVHLNNCSTTALKPSAGSANLAGLFYTHNNPEAGFDPKKVTIKNCSAVDCAIKSDSDCGDFTNSGVITGRAGNEIEYEISDIYINNFQNAGNASTTTTNGAGLLLGTTEGTASVSINNVGIFNSAIQGVGYEIVGKALGAPVEIQNVVAMKNNVAGFVGRYAGALTYQNCYTDQDIKIQKLTSDPTSEISTEEADVIKEQEGITETDAEGAVLENAAVAYAINDALGEDAKLYWTLDEDGNITAGNRENRVYKVTVIREDGQSEIYANGGTEIPDVAMDGLYFYVAQGNGTLTDGVLKVSTDQDTVVRVISEDSAAYKVVEKINYYAGKNLDYYANANLAENLERAKEELANGTYNDETVANAMVTLLTPVYNSGEKINAEVTNIPRVTERSTYSDALNFRIADEEDWDSLETNIDQFNNAEIVIHLAADIDLSKITFVCFDNPYFAFDGHGHTVRNWGTEVNPASSNGMFLYNNNEGRMKFIKNLTIDNCHTKGTDACSSLLVSFAGGNVGQLYAAAEFTIENVHIKNSSVVGTGNQNSIFITGYATKSWDYTLNIKNCSLINTVLNAGSGGGHAGMLIGKLSDNQNGKNGTVNLSNIYVSGNTFNAGRDCYDTLLIGNVEGGNVKVTLKNIYAGGNKAVYKAGQIGYILNAGNGRDGINTNCQNTIINGVVLQDNNISTSGTETARGIITTVWNGTATLTDVYCNDTAVTWNNAAMSITSVSSTPLTAKVNDSYMTSGEAAYALNKNATADSLYWYTTDENGVALGTEANATRKVTLQLANGKVVKTLYANGGEKVTLSVLEDAGATFSASGATIAGNVLTMPTTGEDVVVTVALADSEAIEVYGYPSVTTVATTATATDYTVANATEWMDLYGKTGYFDSYDITIHLIGDIDLGESVAASFKGFKNVKFKMDGHDHTIKNWGTAASPVSAGGLFYSNGASVTSSLKNFTLENAHMITDTGLTGSGRGSSLVYGFYSGNGGHSGIPTSFVMENVHVRESSFNINTTADDHAILLTKYASADALASVTIRNCSIIDTSMDNSAGAAHVGGVLGKACNLNATVSDIYIKNFDVDTTGNSAYAGLVFGTVESQVKGGVINLDNIGVFDSSINAGEANPAALLGTYTSNSAWSFVRNCIFKDIEVTAASKWFMYTTKTSVNMSVNTTSICDMADVATQYATGATAGAVHGVAGKSITYKSDADFASGAVAYTVNGNLATVKDVVSSHDLYWKTENGEVVAAPLANSTRKLTVSTASGNAITSYYVNGGEEKELPAIEGQTLTLASGSSSTAKVAGNVVTMPTDGTDLTVLVSNEDAETAAVYTYPSITSVTAAVPETGPFHYTIYNETDWDNLESRVRYFDNPAITIHLAADIDLSKIDFMRFLCPSFSFDGHGHTVSNWHGSNSTGQSPAMFNMYSDSYGGMRYIKNLTLENCHTKSYGGDNAGMLFAVRHGNGGYANLSTDFTVENIHIRNSSITGEGGGMSGFLITGYAHNSSNYAINVKNCSVVGSRIDAKSANHMGFLIGKLVANNNSSGNKATVNISNCYIADNTINNAPAAYHGVVVGTTEANVTLNASSLVADGNIINGSGVVNTQFCHNDRATINVEGVILNDKTFTTTSTSAVTNVIFSTYSVSDTTGKGILNNVFSNGAVTADLQGASGLSVIVGNEAMTSGRAAAAVNNAATDDTVFYYTTTENGVELGTEANATRRVVYSVDSREVKFIDYANGGEEIAISGYAYDPEATLKFEEETLNAGDPFTVPTAGYMIVPIDVKTTGNDTLTTVYSYPAVTTVTATADKTDYTVANAEEWMELYEKTGYFDSYDITIHLIGEIDLGEVVAASFKGFKNVKFKMDGHDHTIKNWGTAASPVSAGGLFYSNGASVTSSLKNFTLENAHMITDTVLTGSGRGSSLVYGFYSGNGGHSGIPTSFVMENVHVRESSFNINTTADDHAILLTKYASADTLASVTIRNCSIIDTSMDNSAGAAHVGGVLGKACNLNATVSDIYIKNFDLDTTGNSANAGLVFGTVESQVKGGVINLDNIGVFDSSINAGEANPAALLGTYTSNSAWSYVRNCIFKDIEVTAASKWFMYTTKTSVNMSANTTSICDMADVAADYVAGATAGTVHGVSGKSITYKPDAEFASGAAAYVVNGNLATIKDVVSSHDFYWTVDAEGNMIPARDGNQTRKVTFQIEDLTGTEANKDYSVGYTGADQKVIDDGLTTADLNHYSWKRSGGSAYSKAESTFTADETVTAAGVFTTILEDAIAYWTAKADEKIVQYFEEGVLINALVEELQAKLAENYYQAQENAVSGLGLDDLAEDTALLRSYEKTYQDPNPEWTNVPKVTEVDAFWDAFHYTISDLEEFKTAKSKENKYPRGSTLHLLDDLDLTTYTNFSGFNRPYFNFDGHEHTISNWKYDGTTAGIAFISRGATNSIKNLTFDKVHLGGSDHSAIVYASHNSDGQSTGNYKLPDGQPISGSLTIENVHVKDSSLTAKGGDQYAIFLPNAQTDRTGGYVINNCSIVNTTLTGNNSGNMSGFVARMHTGANIAITNCYIEGFDLLNGKDNVSLFFGATTSGTVNVTLENCGAFDCELNASGKIYLCGSRATSGGHNLRNILLGNIVSNTDDAAYITIGNLDNYNFVDAETGEGCRLGHQIVNIYADETTLSHLHEDYPIYHKHDSNPVDDNTKTPIVLKAEDFTNGKAAWEANGVLALAEKEARWLVGEHGDYPMIDSLADSGWKVPYQINLVESRTAEGETYDFYTDKAGVLNTTAQTQMGGYEWYGAEETPLTYNAASAHTYDNTLTLESIVSIDVTWGEMQFVYDFGEWDEDNCQWIDYGWAMEAGTSNEITLANTGTVYKEVALSYAQTADDYGLPGQFTDLNDAVVADTSAIPLNADGTAAASAAYKFMLNDIPDELWDDEAKTVGTLTVALK